MRSTSFDLLPKLLFRCTICTSSGNQTSISTDGDHPTIYDGLLPSTIDEIERMLLESLLQESVGQVRKKANSAATFLANKTLKRGRKWDALRSQVLDMGQSTDMRLRLSALQIIGGSTQLFSAQEVTGLLEVGLKDLGNADVRIVTTRRLAMAHICTPTDEDRSI